MSHRHFLHSLSLGSFTDVVSTGKDSAGRVHFFRIPVSPTKP